MSWHTTNHFPEDGSEILVIYKGCNSGNIFKIKFIDGESNSHLEKWCYYEDYKDSMKRKILNEKDI